MDNIIQPITEQYFIELQQYFRLKYLKRINYEDRLQLHQNPIEIKIQTIREIHDYEMKICTREEMRDHDPKKNAAGHVVTKIKELWDADKRLLTIFDALKRYCELRTKDINIIGVHLAEYYALDNLAKSISDEIYKAPQNEVFEYQDSNKLDNSELQKIAEESVAKWEIAIVEKKLLVAFDHNSELKLLEVLKENSFLFYELYSRKAAIQPVFSEVNFGAKLRCDFAWLNDNSAGPEWVLVEIEKPRMKIFSKNGKPSSELNDAIEQVRSWDRYFKENPSEKKRIFGAVARFRFILVAGDKESWSSEKSIKWRSHHNSETNIEIRSSDVFFRALNLIKSNKDAFWSFAEKPIAFPFSLLDSYWENYDYMNLMRKIFS